MSMAIGNSLGWLPILGKCTDHIRASCHYIWKCFVNTSYELYLRVGRVYETVARGKNKPAFTLHSSVFPLTSKYPKLLALCFKEPRFNFPTLCHDTLFSYSSSSQISCSQITVTWIHVQVAVSRVERCISFV